MKKIKKHLPVAKAKFLSVTSCSMKFTTHAEQSLSVIETRNNKMYISAPDKLPGDHNIRQAIKRYFGPVKMKYRYVGKTYRVRTKDNIIFMRFNKAHKTYLLHSENKLVYYKNKGFWLTMWKSHQEIVGIRSTLNLLRPRNRFTSRGI